MAPREALFVKLLWPLVWFLVECCSVLQPITEQQADDVSWCVLNFVENGAGKIVWLRDWKLDPTLSQRCKQCRLHEFSSRTIELKDAIIAACSALALPPRSNSDLAHNFAVYSMSFRYLFTSKSYNNIGHYFVWHMNIVITDYTDKI